MEKITTKNCVELARSVKIELTTYEEIKKMAQAWQIIHTFCIQNKMKLKPEEKPLETVIRFLRKKI